MVQLAKYEKAKSTEKATFALAMAAEQEAEAVGFNNESLSKAAKTAIGDWRNAHLKASKAKRHNRMPAVHQPAS